MDVSRNFYRQSALQLEKNFFRFCVNLGGEYLLQYLTIYLIVNALVNIIKL